MKSGQLIAVNSKLYEYVGWDEKLKIHKVAVVEIDDEGILTNTHSPWCLTAEELVKYNNIANFTEAQWHGIVSHIIRQNHDVTEEEITEAAEDIVGRCFAYGIPQFDELEEYIECYMNR